MVLVHNSQGPFHGFGTEFRLYSQPYRGGIITSPVDARVINVVHQSKALSRNQISSLVKSRSARSAVTRLVRAGYLDEYQSGTTPPIYTLGRGGAEIKEVPYRWWKTLELLRMVAANQLWVCLSSVWPEAEWVSGPVAQLVRGALSFAVIAPRQMAGESVFAVQRINALQPTERLIVVAATELQAKEIVSLVGQRGNVRYVWDAVLVHGPLFYVYDGQNLVVDEGFRNAVQSRIDDPGAVGDAATAT